MMGCAENDLGAHSITYWIYKFVSYNGLYFLDDVFSINNGINKIINIIANNNTFFQYFVSL